MCMYIYNIYIYIYIYIYIIYIYIYIFYILRIMERGYLLEKAIELPTHFFRVVSYVLMYLTSCIVLKVIYKNLLNFLMIPVC